VLGIEPLFGWIVACAADHGAGPKPSQLSAGARLKPDHAEEQNQSPGFVEDDGKRQLVNEQIDGRMMFACRY
jgi:hypothetical protein